MWKNMFIKWLNLKGIVHQNKQKKKIQSFYTHPHAVGSLAEVF